MKGGDVLVKMHTFQPHLWTIHGSARNPVPVYTLDSLSRSSATITLFVVCCLLLAGWKAIELRVSMESQLSAWSVLRQRDIKLPHALIFPLSSLPTYHFPDLLSSPFHYKLSLP